MLLNGVGKPPPTPGVSKVLVGKLVGQRIVGQNPTCQNVPKYLLTIQFLPSLTSMAFLMMFGKHKNQKQVLGSLSSKDGSFLVQCPGFWLQVGFSLATPQAPFRFHC